ncbi:helicase SNF2 [Variovorax sp. S2]|jgi:hypothetical protein|uniref:helicase SNF2 n=1 Tax=Variovorax sp. S12S4 TaxID=3029170 RepID=UPI00215CF7B7|nr:helicase SNF2 [Variovorax sp. S12S4]MCR8960603.1 helicase SNF2 [Variovorax sp. S12S4]
MNTRKLLTAIAATSLVSFAASGASAEEYQGVLQFSSTVSRADVRVQAAEAARNADPYAEGASAGVPVATASLANRAPIRAEAIATARAGNLYGDGASASVPSRSATGFARITVRSGI